MLVGLIEAVSGVSGWIRGSKKHYIHTWQVSTLGRNDCDTMSVLSVSTGQNFYFPFKLLKLYANAQTIFPHKVMWKY